MDYKSVFTNLCLELQQNRSWIKGLGKNPFTHSIPFTHSLTAVPFVRGHRSVFPRTPRNTGVYTRHPTFVTATSGVLTRLPAWLSKNRMRVYTLSEAKGLRVDHTVIITLGLLVVSLLSLGVNGGGNVPHPPTLGASAPSQNSDSWEKHKLPPEYMLVFPTCLPTEPIQVGCGATQAPLFHPPLERRLDFCFAESRNKT